MRVVRYAGQPMVSSKYIYNKNNTAFKNYNKYNITFKKE